MKEVLDYTKEELQSLSDEELKVLLREAEDKETLYDVRQKVEKLLINGLYGALATKFFPLFNEDIAAAITGNGRYFIQKLANYIEDKLQQALPQEKPYIIYGDTDSVVGSTLVRTDKGNIKIEDLYNQLNGYIEIRGNNNFIKHVTDKIKSGSISKNLEYQEKQINYVMSHKVKKRMFKIKCNGDEVTITEDHSMVVIRNDKLIEIKPKDIQKNDKLVKITNK